MKWNLWPWSSPNSPADWFARLRGGPITPRLDARFRHWISADGANERRYERQEFLWELSGELASDAEIESLTHDAQHDAPSDRARRNRTLEGNQRRMLAWAAGIATISALSAGWILLNREPEGTAYATNVGEQRSVVLPDKSRMMLNTATRVRVSFGKIRSVVLEQGEATFTVMPDPKRPFEAHAGGGVARALGTEFNVLSAADGVTVSVLSGVVSVAPGEQSGTGTASRSSILRSGQAAHYAPRSPAKIGVAEVSRINGWHSQRIVLENVRLDAALAEFNRYTDTPLQLADDSLADLRLSGVFRVGEAGGLLRALNVAFGIESTPGQKVILLRRKAHPPTPPHQRAEAVIADPRPFR